MQTTHCIAEAGGAMCAVADDYFVFTRRWSFAPLLHVVNQVLAYKLSVTDLGAYRGLALLLAALQVLSINWVYKVLEEITFVGDAFWGTGLRLKTAWDPGRAFFGDLALLLAGVAVGAAFEAATNAPPHLSIEPYRWRYIWFKYVAQNFLVLWLGTSGISIQTPDPEYDRRFFRTDFLMYAATKTIALVIIYMWNRLDAWDRVRVYGIHVEYYDRVWGAFFFVYAMLILPSAWLWTTPFWIALLGCGVALLAVAAVASTDWAAQSRAAYKSQFGRLLRRTP